MKYFDRIADAEEGFGCSLSFADVFTSASNVVGSTSVYQLAPWLDPEHRVPLKRTTLPVFSTKPAPAPPAEEEPKYGKGEPPPELLNTDRLKHGRRRVLSVIENELGEAAKWRAVTEPLWASHAAEDARAGHHALRVRLAYAKCPSAKANRPSCLPDSRKCVSGLTFAAATSAFAAR